MATALVPYDALNHAVKSCLLHMLQPVKLFIGPRREGRGLGPRCMTIHIVNHSVLPKV